MERPNSHLVLEHINNIVIPGNQSGIGGVMDYIEDYLITSDREHMFVIALDDDNLPLNVNMAHVGTINRSVASARDVVKPALLSKASQLVVLHNHPSGDTLPSNEDKLFTERLSNACHSVGLSLVEHYVVGLEKGKYSRLIQTEETDRLLTTNYQQPHVSEVPVVNLKLNHAVNATYSKTYNAQEELESEIKQFIDSQQENKHYVFGFGTKNQLVSIIGASDKVFSHPKGMEMIRQRLILSNANKVVFSHVKPLKNNAEFLEHYTWIENEKRHFDLFEMNVLDAFVFFKDKSLSVSYAGVYDQTEFFKYCQDNTIEQPAILREESKKLTKEEMKQLPIIEVAQSLGMNMIRSGREYYWDEHDSLKINPSKNRFSWYSRDIHGDTIKLVQTIREIPFAQAVQFLQTGTYTENHTPKVEPKQPFIYPLKPYETTFEQARRYLVEERKLAPETVDFFVSKGSMVSANYKTKDTPAEEVIIFQYKDYQDKIVGGSMQGITPNKGLHPGKGYLKKILFNSEGTAGFKVDVGTPERLIFFEAPIDLMSYYELNQDKLQNVRLIAMDGLKEVVISRALMEFMAFQHHTPAEKLNASLSRVNEYLDFVVESTTFFEEPGNDQMITLAVDNDEAGLKFIEKLQDKGCVFQVELPEKPENLSKMDWNALLYSEKEKQNELSQEKDMDVYVDDKLTKHGLTVEQKQHLTTFLETQVPNITFQTAFTWFGQEREIYKLGEFYITDRYAELDRLSPQKQVELLTKEVLESYGKPISLVKKREYDAFDPPAEDNEHSESYDDRYDDPRFDLDYIKSIFGYDDTVDLSFYKEHENHIDFITNSEKTKKALDNKQEQKDAETNNGDLPGNQEAAPLPEVSISQPLSDWSPNQAQSQPLLQFTIDGILPSTHKNNYHPITAKELRKLNRYAQNIQHSAEWYLNNLADTKLIYLYSDGHETGKVDITFGKEHFMHLTGLLPQKVGQTAEQTLLDFAQGRGHFEHLLIANYNGAFEKLQVLPELQEIISSDAFYFDDLSDIEKLHRLNLDKAIRTSDKDLLLALRTVDDTVIPASLMRLKSSLNIQLDSILHKVILGVYRERNGALEQLSINEEYIKDGGKEMMSILENREEILEPIFQNIDSSVSDIEKIDRTKDSDGDGISDYDEIQQGTDPNNSRSNSKEKQQDNNDVPISELIANNDRLGLMTHLKEGMKQFAHSQQYKTYLTAMSKFYHYSPRNLQLLLAQNPHIQQVASYQSWQKDFERQVVKGEKALKVFVPLLVKQKDDNGNFIVDDNGEIQTRTIYKLGNVFDVSQTEGKALPQPVYRLESSVEGYKELYQAIKYINSQNDVSIHFDTLPGGVNGLYQPLENRIVISNRGMSEAQIIKTLIHETAHAQLHQKGNVNQLSDEYAIQELRAESIAYVVANHYGIDTSEYSFGYLHVWSGDKVDYSDLEKSLTTIQQTSKQFIEKIDTTLEKIKSNTLQKNQFNVNLEKAKQAEAQTILNKSVGGDVTKKMITPTAEKS